MITIGTVRIRLTDLMSYWPTDTGVLGRTQVEGHFIALMLKNAPALVRAGFESEADRDKVLARLDKLKKARKF
jgi:hypothetical protein